MDEQTFIRCFGGCDWALMGILGRTGRTYARLRFNAGPGTSLVIPTRVDWASWPALVPELPQLLDDWQREYDAFVEVVEFRIDNWFGSTPAKMCQPATATSALVIPPSPLSELGALAESSDFHFFHPDFDPFLPQPRDNHAFD